MRGRHRRERADHGEGGQIDALGAKAGRADGGDEPLDHVAASCHEDDPLARALGRVDHADGLEVEYGAVERHRQLVLRLEADGGRELLAGDARGKLEGTEDDPAVGDADAHPLVEVVRAEELAQRVGERVNLGDLAVADDAGVERDGRGVLDRHATVDVHRGRGHVTRFDVEPDDRAGVVGAKLHLAGSKRPGGAPDTDLIGCNRARALAPLDA